MLKPVADSMRRTIITCDFGVRQQCVVSYCKPEEIDPNHSHGSNVQVKMQKALSFLGLQVEGLIKCQEN